MEAYKMIHPIQPVSSILMNDRVFVAAAAGLPAWGSGAYDFACHEHNLFSLLDEERKAF
jgi:hypothetical protein